MVSEKMQAAINEQINKEIGSAYLYQSMEAYAKFEGLKGVANWFNVQAQEEWFHANKFIGYLDANGCRVVLLALAKPESEFSGALSLFEKTLAHEKTVTASINALVDLARKENDHATETFLQWFVTEQVEEEANPRDLIDQIKLAGGPGPGLFFIDKDLAGRVFTPPAPTVT